MKGLEGLLVAAAQKARDEHAVKLDESQLTEAERKVVNDFSEKIDITDSTVVLQYGAAAQKNIASFSENALASVRTKDLGQVGDALSDLVVELKGFGAAEEKKGFLGLFKKIAEEEDVPLYHLIMEVSKENRKNPSEEQIRMIAAALKA